MIDVALIYGSARPGRLCDRVAGWVAGEMARQGGFLVREIDPLADGLARALAADEPAAAAALEERLAHADAFVVTPEYNHGYPAALKLLIDGVAAAWQAKPVGFVSYGGVSGGLRAVEQLRTVFAELHAVAIRDQLCFPNAHRRFAAAGTLLEPAQAERSMAVMLARLRWWALALREARAARPYALAA